MSRKCNENIYYIRDSVRRDFLFRSQRAYYLKNNSPLKENEYEALQGGHHDSFAGSVCPPRFPEGLEGSPLTPCSKGPLTLGKGAVR